MMKEMSIDLETYSDVNITKCGAYKYAESDEFEILLFGVSVDGGAVLKLQDQKLKEGKSVTYEGVGSTKKWERIESYGPKFVENIVQAVSRDILCYAMKTLRHSFIVGHVHDELIIECSPNVDLNVICKQMGKSPDWMSDILLRADGYETFFYKKD